MNADDLPPVDQAMGAGLGPPEVTDAWVEAILAHLHPESGERLLDLGSDELRALDHSFRTEARSIVFELEMPEEERREVLASDRTTASLAFEEPEKYAHAAAWYAVMHDRLRPEASVALRAFLRLQVGRCLHQLGDDRDIAERCVSILLPLAETPEALHLSQSEEAVNEIRFMVYEVLGLRLGQLDYRHRAVHFLDLAADTAPNIDLRIGAVCSALKCLEAAGEIQKAYRRLEAERPRAMGVTDPEIKDLWDAQELSLQQKLGLRDLNPPGAVTTALRLPVWMSGDWLRHDQKPSATVLERLRGEFESMAEQEAHDAPEDLRGRHSLLLGQLGTIDPRTNSASWDAILRQAEDLEPHFGAEGPKLRRRLLAARLLFVRGMRSAATDAYGELWPDAQRLFDPSGQLATLGWYLQALAFDQPLAHRDLILDLAGWVQRLMPVAIATGSTVAARAGIRDLNQRTVEAALFALLAAHKEGGHSLRRLAGTSQNALWAAEQEGFLARAEELVLAMRNPELNWGRPTLPPEALMEHRTLEEDFHRGLRAKHLGNGQNPEVRKALRRLLEFEAAWQEPAAVTTVIDPESKGDFSLRLCLCELRDLFDPPSLLILRSTPEGRTIHFEPLDPEHRILDDWQSALCSQTAPLEAQTGPIEEPVRDLARRLFGDNDPGVTIDLSLEAAWHEVPIDMLPDPWRPGKRLGATHAFQVRLRPGTGIPTGVVDLGRGWLGVGGVPAAGIVPYLEASLIEVESIAMKLEEHGVRSSILSGKQAGRTRLLEALAARPAALHISTHGIASDIDPDCSALLLASDPLHGDSELFTFRQILGLDASGLELVVLSACSSLVGRKNHSGGLQGLAWAFLKAGARAVLASRYRVRDAMAAALMSAFYQYLLVEPPAEAVRHARADLLESGAFPGDVGAWALWT